MDPISIALGLAQFVPSIIKWVSGDENSTAAKVADTVVGVAKGITGKGSGEAALAAIQADPQLQAQMQQAWMAHEVSLYQEETKRLEAVNSTIKVEAVSGDPYVRRMRPTFGYVLAASWGTLMLAITYQIIRDPAAAAVMIEAVASLGTMWGVALAVLGVHVWGRSNEKQTAMGASPGLLGGLFGKKK